MRIITLVILLLTTVKAFAYIGPGTGIGFITTVLAVIGSLFLFVLGILYYPIKRLLKAIKARRNQKK